MRTPSQHVRGPHVVTLGTAGGPRWWPRQNGVPPRAGIATAVVVGDAFYLVDCGHGVGRQLQDAGLTMDRLRGVFITHLHSDHTIDLNSLLVFGILPLRGAQGRVIPVVGPGDRGMLPPVSPRAVLPPEPMFPERPTPGVAAMVELLARAHATDLNDRMLDSLAPSPLETFQGRDIAVPRAAGFHPNENPTPDMEPFEVYHDDLVTVSATLVLHPPMAPAFAFRFDTAEGSVTISGDTAPCENLVRLALGTDLLLHEAIDLEFMGRMWGDPDDPNARASMDHHRRSHTSPEDAGRIADRAGARALALHHLVPGTAPASVWEQASSTYSGPLYVPDDLTVLPLRSADRAAAH